MMKLNIIRPSGEPLVKLKTLSSTLVLDIKKFLSDEKIVEEKSYNINLIYGNKLLAFNESLYTSGVEEKDPIITIVFSNYPDKDRVYIYFQVHNISRTNERKYEIISSGLKTYRSQTIGDVKKMFSELYRKKTLPCLYYDSTISHPDDILLDEVLKKELRKDHFAIIRFKDDDDLNDFSTNISII